MRASCRREALQRGDDLGVGGAVIDQAQLPVRVRLLAYGGDRLLEHVGRRVVDGHSTEMTGTWPCSTVSAGWAGRAAVGAAASLSSGRPRWRGAADMAPKRGGARPRATAGPCRAEACSRPAGLPAGRGQTPRGSAPTAPVCRSRIPPTRGWPPGGHASRGAAASPARKTRRRPPASTGMRRRRRFRRRALGRAPRRDRPSSALAPNLHQRVRAAPRAVFARPRATLVWPGSRRVWILGRRVPWSVGSSRNEANGESA